jgi:hypothetical protein
MLGPLAVVDGMTSGGYTSFSSSKKIRKIQNFADGPATDRKRDE